MTRSTPVNYKGYTIVILTEEYHPDIRGVPSEHYITRHHIEINGDRCENKVGGINSDPLSDAKQMIDLLVEDPEMYPLARL